MSEQRWSTRAHTVELLECLKSWFRIGIYTQEDLHAIIAAEQQIDQSEALN